MSHALARSALRFGIARFFLGLGEAGNFPAAIKTVADWFPRSERSLATGIFNSGANLGAMVAPAVIPWVAVRFGWRAAFLATGVLSATWIVWWYRNYRRPTDHPTLTGEELRHIYEDAAEQMGPRIPWLRLLRLRQTLAFAAAKVPYRSDLVVFTFSGCRVSSIQSSIWGCRTWALRSSSCTTCPLWAASAADGCRVCSSDSACR